MLFSGLVGCLLYLGMKWLREVGGGEGEVVLAMVLFIQKVNLFVLFVSSTTIGSSLIKPADRINKFIQT